jgi:hypothetical protein
MDAAFVAHASPTDPSSKARKKALKELDRIWSMENALKSRAFN